MLDYRSLAQSSKSPDDQNFCGPPDPKLSADFEKTALNGPTTANTAKHALNQKIQFQTFAAARQLILLRAYSPCQDLVQGCPEQFHCFEVLV